MFCSGLGPSFSVVFRELGVTEGDVKTKESLTTKDGRWATKGQGKKQARVFGSERQTRTHGLDPIHCRSVRTSKVL